MRIRSIVGSLVVIAGFAASVVSAQTAPKGPVAPAAQESFLGKWKLNESKTAMVHSGDNDQAIQWRSYERDGDRVKVSWGNQSGPAGSYSAKCDGTIERAANGNIHCWQAGENIVDGEQLNKADPLHRYYRRTVAPDGKSMTISWYADAKHRRKTDHFIYEKE